MSKYALATGLCALLALLAGCNREPPAPVAMAHGKFSEVRVFHEDGNDKPPVILVSDDQSEAALTDGLIRQMLDDDIDVIAVSEARLRQDFPVNLRDCNSMTGDFENLARYIEAYLQYPRYITPVLATSPGSAPALRRVLSPVASKVFLGMLSFYADKPSAARKDTNDCPVRPVTVKVAPAPTFSIPLRGKPADNDVLEETMAELVERMPATQDLDSTVADLPLTELPGKDDVDTMAVLISGDGGWAGFDKDLAEAMQTKGIAVVGWDSLRYFWKERTPESVAADLDKVVTFYAQHWHKKKVYLLGFSQGANVLPFSEPLLTADVRKLLAKVVLISPEKFAQFEFHMANWVKATDSGRPTAPALDKVNDVPYLCVYGSNDKNSACPGVKNPRIKVHGFEGGHHLFQNISIIVNLMLEPA